VIKLRIYSYSQVFTVDIDPATAIKAIKPPVVRWPGGNFVSQYHWMDGIGPRDKRPKRFDLA